MYCKRHISLACLLFSALFINADNTDMHGFTTQETIVIPDVLVQTSEIPWVARIVPYTNGGITITYDEEVFTEPPIIFASLQVGTYDDTVAYTPVVTANSTTSTTIRVNVANGVSVAEAATDSVTVMIYAFGN